MMVIFNLSIVYRAADAGKPVLRHGFFRILNYFPFGNGYIYTSINHNVMRLLLTRPSMHHGADCPLMELETGKRIYSGDWNWVIFVQSSIHTARPSLSLQSSEKLPTDSLQGHSLQARLFSFSEPPFHSCSATNRSIKIRGK